jgi:hypothetical protein
MTYIQEKQSRDTLENHLKESFETTSLSKTTKQQYSKKLAQWVEFTQDKTLYDLLTQRDMAMTALTTTPHIKHSPTNHHVYISALVGFVNHIYLRIVDEEEKNNGEEILKEWKEIQKGNWEPLSEHYAKNEPTERQKEKQMDVNEIETIRQTLQKGSPERLLLTLYTRMEPVRADYYATEIIQENGESKEENYIILTPATGRLVIRDFKTKHRYEKIENNLPDEVVEEIHTSLHDTPRTYLFTTDENRPYTRKLFSNWACRTLSRVLNQPMTLTVLRHLYISKKIQDNTSLEDLKEIAKKMGHSRDMQRVYNWS